MKRLISIILSAVMVLSMSAGLDFSVLAADVSGLEFQPKNAYVLYEGNNSYPTSGYVDGEGNVEYECYNISNYDLLKEGNTLTVSYSDETSKTFTCQMVEIAENHTTPKFKAEDGSIIEVKDLSVSTNQSAENQWQIGNSYTAYVEYGGQSADFTVSVEANPIREITVYTTGDITLMENCAGNEEDGGAWYNYTTTLDYLRAVDAVINVDYADGTNKGFHFVENKWLPVDENENEINNDYFRFNFDQWDKHFTLGNENVAIVSYYGREYKLPVTVIAKGDVNEGAAELGFTKNILFYSNENHTVSFTPDYSGWYIFDKSIADRVRQNEFNFVMTCGDEVIPPLEDNKLIFNLKADKTYNLTLSNKSEDDVRIENLEVNNTIIITDLNFTPASGDFSVYEGDISDDSIFKNPGDVIELEFSDGAVESFTCNDCGCFYNDNDIAIDDYCKNKGIQRVWQPYCKPSDTPWVYNDNAYITIYLGEAYSQNIPVTVKKSPIKAIAYAPVNPMVLYDGTQSERHDNIDGTDVEYGEFEINRWDVFDKGDVLTVTNDDDSEEVFTYKWSEADDEDLFVSDKGNKINPNDFNIYYVQDYEHQWTVGNSYSFDLIYMGRHAAVPVSIENNPVTSISVTTDKTVTLFRNINGTESYDDETDSDYFDYYGERQYFMDANAVITVNYASGTSTEYKFRDNDWTPTDKDGNGLDNRQLRFWFDSRGTAEKNACPEGVVSYYSNEYRVPVQVVDKHDVDNGEIKADVLKSILFISDEEHTMTFTPESDGVYRFSESLFYDYKYDGRFNFSVKLNGVIVNPKDDGELDKYELKGGTEYTITVSSNSDSDVRYEYLKVEARTFVSSIEFTPASPLVVTEGDLFNEEMINQKGNTIKVTLSNGESDLFTYGDEHAYANSEGMWISDYMIKYGMDGYPNVEGSHDVWEYGKESYITIHLGAASTTCAVTVNKSAVSSIAYTPAKPLEIIYDLIWHWTDEQDVYNSEIVDVVFKKGDILTVTYSDDRGTVKYICRDERHFVNENDEDDVICPEYLYDNHRVYNVGDTFDFLISYQTGKVNVSATVIENPIASAVYAPANPFVFDEGAGMLRSKVVFNEETGQNETLEYRVYEGEIFEKGSTITITDKQGKVTVYTSDGKDFVSEDGDVINSEQVGALWGRDQYEHPYTVDGNNIIYVHYMSFETPVPVTIVKRDAWKPYVNAVVNGKDVYNSGSTVKLENGQSLYVYFESDDRNIYNGVSSYIGFPYESLTQAGFKVTEGKPSDFGYTFGNQYTYGLKIEAENLAIGTKAELPVNLHQNAENFNWQTPVLFPYSFNFEVTNHIWNNGVVTKQPTYDAEGSRTFTCTICGKTEARPIAKLPKTSLAKATVTGIVNKEYAAKALTQKIVVKLGKTTLKNGTDYTVTYANNKNVGTATVKIAGKGKYNGSITKTFLINPKNTTKLSVKSGSKSLTVTWKKNTAQTTGYEVQYGLNKNFKGAKKVKITKNKTVKTVINNLKSKKNYYVRIRTYKTIKKKTYYSTWKTFKPVKTK